MSPTRLCRAGALNYWNLLYLKNSHKYDSLGTDEGHHFGHLHDLFCNDSELRIELNTQISKMLKVGREEGREVLI